MPEARIVSREQSFEVTNPPLLLDWDETNDRLPSTLSKTSCYKAKWKCHRCGHRWQATLKARTNRNQGCPNCVFAPSEEVQELRRKWTNVANEDYLWASSHSLQVWEWKCPECGLVFQQKFRHFKGQCPQCHPAMLATQKVNNSVADVAPHLLPEWSPTNVLKPDSVTYNSARSITWVCQEAEHVWCAPVYQRVNSNSGCPQCSQSQRESSAEYEIVDYIKSLGVSNIEQHNRTILQGKELDIWLPDFNMAIEYNGLYWHREEKVGRRYHYEKWKSCHDQGIQLLTIWSDDWEQKTEIVKAMLQHKLSKASVKVGARSTTLLQLDYRTASAFLNQYHIQGDKQGSYYLGLEYNNELVAVSVFTKDKNNSLVLDRYATSIHVVGGLGKLLKAVQTLVPELNQIRTFAAHDVSNGNLYEALGFQATRELKIDYMYIVNKVRVHKFNYRKARFAKDADLTYEDGLTETQLAQLNNLSRIWDAGKTEYTLYLTS